MPTSSDAPLSECKHRIRLLSNRTGSIENIFHIDRYPGHSFPVPSFRFEIVRIRCTDDRPFEPSQTDRIKVRLRPNGSRKRGKYSSLLGDLGRRLFIAFDDGVVPAVAGGRYRWRLGTSAAYQ